MASTWKNRRFECLSLVQTQIWVAALEWVVAHAAVLRPLSSQALELNFVWLLFAACVTVPGMACEEVR